MSNPPRILIVTAAFGEGHNSAARNLSLALENAGAVTQVADPCFIGMPRLSALVSTAYRIVTTHFPRLWAAVYRSTDRCDFNKSRSPILRRPQQVMAHMIAKHRPDAVVSTYPIYPYFMPGILASDPSIPRPLPVFTVVTDSIEINAAWLRAPSDWWLVTDGSTREAMAGRGIESTRIIETGFPVHPAFSSLQTVAQDDSCDTFRVLYFPTAKSSLLCQNAEVLLESSPSLRLTIVMGRNVRRHLPHAEKIRRAYPGRVRLIGWTHKVPQLLSQHHLIIGKAGGATVHEAIAARCPMLIHHLVPGQEEGNLRLLEAIGGGALAQTPEEMTRRIRQLLANQAAGWREMKAALARHAKNAGAITAARFILDEIASGASRVPSQTTTLP